LSTFAAWAAAPQLASAQGFRAEYEAAVLGQVPVGRVSIQTDAANGRYSTSAALRTSGVAALFDQTNITARASGMYGPRGVAWTAYDLSHAYARKFRRTTMRRTGGAVHAVVSPRYGDMGRPPATPREQARAFDPLSGLFVLGRLVGQSRACTGVVRIFDGRRHYRIALSPRTTGAFRGGGYDGPAVLCNLRYTPISGYDMAKERRSPIPTVQIWYTRPPTPGIAVPLRLTAPTPIGDAQLDIRSYRVTP
jgi:hypothetical protein